MRITGAAVSFISLPSPKANPFRGGPKKDKKSRSFNKVFAPIRRLGKQFSQRSSLNSKQNKGKHQASERLLPRDEEQGWIAQAASFETEDTLTPKSLDSIITSDSPSMMKGTGEKNSEIIFCSVLDSPQQVVDDDEYIDLEVGFNESANIVSDDEIEDHETHTEQCEEEYAAPPVSTKTEDVFNTNVQENSGNQFSPIEDLDYDKMSDDQEASSHSMMSLLSRIDTTEVIDEADEIDSLAPAADISFFLNEEGGNNFHCVGRLSTPQKNREPPVQIDVDSIDDRSSNSPSTSNNESRGLYIEEEDDFSLSSYHSYMQAIGSITDSASRKVEGAFSMAMNEFDEETPQFIPVALDSDSEVETDDEDDCVCVSFNPSRELLLQAMEGASSKAKADIERATALALSKMNSTNSMPSKRKPVKSVNPPNLILGFLFFVLLFFQLSGDTVTVSQGIKSISHAVGIDQFQIIARNSIVTETESVHGPWASQQMLGRRNDTYETVNNRRFYNIGCKSKVACLALGSM